MPRDYETRDEFYEQLMGRVERRWDLSGDTPVPKWDIQCPVCGSTELRKQRHRFHKRPEGWKTNPYRCDMHYKCADCSYILNPFGVPTPREMNERAVMPDA